MPSNRGDHIDAFTSKSNGRVRELITPIGLSEAYTLGEEAPKPQIHNMKALWDTGATNCVITKKVATQLNLAPVSKAIVHGVDGPSKQNVYLVNIYLPNRYVSFILFEC